MSEQIEGIIHPATRPGRVALTVPDLERSLRFYRDGFGLQVHHRQGHHASLGAGGGKDILELVEDPQALRPAEPTTGLYHMAILLPSRLALAGALRRLLQAGWPLQGAADHLVSEAIYLADPDGNGIEIYCDRPREQWPYRAGQLQMATEPLDLDGLLAESDNAPRPGNGLPAGTQLGHVHLKVANIPEAERFYCQVLGFELVTRYGPSAAFVSAGGYHHHIGMNTWESAGAPSPATGSAGLRYFSLQLPGSAEMEKITARVRQAGLTLEEKDQGWLVRDPSGNGVLLVVDTGLVDA